MQETSRAGTNKWGPPVGGWRDGEPAQDLLARDWRAGGGGEEEEGEEEGRADEVGARRATRRERANQRQSQGGALYVANSYVRTKYSDCSVALSVPR